MTAVVAAVGTQVFTLPSSLAATLAADEGEVGTTEAGTEEVEEAPNPILPVWSEVFWNVGASLVLVAVMKFIAYPAVRRAIDARNAKVEGDLLAAEQAKAHADTVLVDYQAKLAQARSQASAIIEEARQSVEAVRSDQLAALNAELATMRAQAAAEIDEAKTRALAELRTGVSDLAVGAAERVVGRSIDRQSQIGAIEAYLREAAEGTTR
jgi:F-type H+-transporting ATPase subunit b